MSKFLSSFPHLPNFHYNFHRINQQKASWQRVTEATFRRVWLNYVCGAGICTSPSDPAVWCPIVKVPAMVLLCTGMFLCQPITDTLRTISHHTGWCLNSHFVLMSYSVWTYLMSKWMRVRLLFHVPCQSINDPIRFNFAEHNFGSELIGLSVRYPPNKWFIIVVLLHNVHKFNPHQGTAPRISRDRWLVRSDEKYFTQRDLIFITVSPVPVLILHARFIPGSKLIIRVNTTDWNGQKPTWAGKIETSPPPWMNTWIFTWTQLLPRTQRPSNLFLHSSLLMFIFIWSESHKSLFEIYACILGISFQIKSHHVVNLACYKKFL